MLIRSQSPFCLNLCTDPEVGCDTMNCSGVTDYFRTVETHQTTYLSANVAMDRGAVEASTPHVATKSKG